MTSHDRDPNNHIRCTAGIPGDTKHLTTSHNNGSVMYTIRDVGLLLWLCSSICQCTLQYIQPPIIRPPFRNTAIKPPGTIRAPVHEDIFRHIQIYSSYPEPGIDNCGQYS